MPKDKGVGYEGGCLYAMQGTHKGSKALAEAGRRQKVQDEKVGVVSVTSCHRAFRLILRKVILLSEDCPCVHAF